MKRALLLVLICMLQISCSSNVTSVPAPTAPVVTQNISTSIPVHPDTFEVVAWVNDPDPQTGTRVILRGSLLKDGVHLGGISMQAFWPDDNHAPGIPDCTALVTYGTGVCIINSTGYQPGDYVPITVSFEYQGKIYKGQTGFTPR
jgi:hypothetical protein